MAEQEKQAEKSPHALREEEVLKFWEEKNIFAETLKKDSPKGEFVFFEGPPTANGKPGIHHLEARAFKDAIPRFKTMQGFHVRRKGGWDTHGLPVELQVEKELKLTSKKDIEKFGVAEFNKKCKESVFTYLEDWGRFTKRIGYWVDQENAYFTFHNSYIESLWNIVKTVADKNLLYKDYKVVPWCPRCGTGLSSHELAQGYQDVKDLSVYAKFKLTNLPTDDLLTYFLAWTTTPWTLPGNVALAVGEEIEYVKVNLEKETLIFAKSRMEEMLKHILPHDQGDGQAEHSVAFTYKEVKGKDLVGLEYEPLYPFLKNELEKTGIDASKAFRVYGADFVTTTDGTGIVHTAVMYGQDDFALGTKVGLPKMHTVNEDGTFKEWCGEFSGRFVKDEAVAIDVIKDLAHRGLLFKKEKYEHSYPHCWRCKTPLIYYARDSWYIKMSSLRDSLMEENQKINWEPSYIKDGRFGEWLKELKDWAISRERYWGTPLPVWESSDGKERFILDSIKTLKEKTKKSGNKYFLMRHGEASHNVAGVLSSDEEAVHELTEKGRALVRENAESLKGENIDLIIHSPILRTAETASVVAEVLGVEAVVDDRLHEERFGVLSGKPWSEFEKIYPTFKDRIFKKFDSAETLMEVKRRVGEFLYDIEKKYTGKNILIVTHDGPAKLMKCVAEGALDGEIEKLYTPGVNFIEPGHFKELVFIPLPHDEEYRLDLHRPYIDTVELVGQNGSLLKRTKEVMDVWFDSGAMPFAQDNYPFSTKEVAFPADFISEAIDQTRGWFYTLHAVGALMGKGRAYKNVICLGHILDKEGKKMSKSLGNIVNPWEMIDKYGVDALRLWMYSVNQPGESKNFDEKTVDEIVKKIFNLVSNVHSFYDLYRDISLESNDMPTSENVLDIWILSRLNEMLSSGTKYLDEFKLFEPVRLLKEFVDDLSTWYVRRSRERLKEEDVDAKKTLYFVLKTLSKYMAPFAPFFAEHLFQKLRIQNDEESVHLEGWPEVVSGEELRVNSEEITKEMKEVRKIVSLGLEQRQKVNIKVRQPLQKLTIKQDLKSEYLEIIKDELNVKEVFCDATLVEEVLLDTVLTLELKEEGVVRDVIREVQEQRKEKNLTPKDRIKVKVYGDQSRNLFEKTEWKSLITKVAQADVVSFEEGEVGVVVEKI